MSIVVYLKITIKILLCYVVYVYVFCVRALLHCTRVWCCLSIRYFCRIWSTPREVGGDSLIFGRTDFNETRCRYSRMSARCLEAIFVSVA